MRKALRMPSLSGSSNPGPGAGGLHRRTGAWIRAGVLGVVLLAVAPEPALANLSLGPWNPLFKGIQHAIGTNTPSTALPHLMVAHALRVDLTDPDIQFLTTPRITTTPYEFRVRETDGVTVRRFLQLHGVQVAVNANFFSTDDNFGGSPNYYLAENTPMVVEGQFISQGVAVSTQVSTDANTAMMFDIHNNVTFIATNWPAAPTNGVYTAVTGLYPLVLNGVNIGGQYLGIPGDVHQAVNPRTGFGLSQDAKTLFIVTIDGRQPGYSDGALDYETGAWMVLAGCYQAMNMDGGGSTTLVMQDPAGDPVLLNESNAAAPNNSGSLRTVGAHLGIFAKPLPGFFNEVSAMPDDVSAGITWTTTAPVTAQTFYGTTTNLGQTGPSSGMLGTNHAALLTGLQPSTQYYFQLQGTGPGGVTTNSPVYSLTTTNYVATTMLFGVTNAWKYSDANLDGVGWTAPGYDDSAWSGPGAGLLWIDVRAGGPDPNVQPKNTQMPGNPNNSYAAGYPYLTYYFRTHFNVANPSPASSLDVTAYIDDGAVFYLNGAEVERLRMPAAPAVIGNATLAIGYPCSGDATCPDEITIANAGASLVNGDNVFAAEVHNYNLGSPDITFGIAPTLSSPNAASAALAVTETNGAPAVMWSRNGFALQQASSPTGPWTDVPGPVLVSPYTPAPGATSVFYRLHR